MCCLEPLGALCGQAWVSAGVSAQGVGSGGGRAVGGRGGAGPGDQRAVDLHLAAAGADRSGSGGGSESARAVRAVLFTETIREVHLASRSTYGGRRVHAELTLGRGLTV